MEKKIDRIPSFDWDKAKYFYYVAKLGSLSESSRFLHLSQPSLSKKISILEDRLKCKLFVRTPKGLDLTRKGEELFTVVEQSYVALKGFTYQLTAQDGKKNIRIATTHAIAAYLLSDLIFEYNQIYPEVTFEIMADDHLLDIVLNDVDVAIRPYDSNANGIQQDYLFTLQRKLYASKDYLAKYGEPEKIEDLKNHFIIAPAKTENFPYSDLEWILKLGLPSGQKHIPVFSSTLIECLVQAAKNGMGIIAAYEVMSLIKDSGLKNILPTIKDQGVKEYLIYPNYFMKDPHIQEFRKFIQKKFTL